MAKKNQWKVIRTMDGGYGVRKKGSKSPFPQIFNIKADEARKITKLLNTANWTLSYDFPLFGLKTKIIVPTNEYIRKLKRMGRKIPRPLYSNSIIHRRAKMLKKRTVRKKITKRKRR